MIFFYYHSLSYMDLCSFVRPDINQAPTATVGMRGDGNCYFRCLSYLLIGSQTEHGKMRAIMVRYMAENRMVFDKLANVKHYLESSSIDLPGVYAIEVELFVRPASSTHPSGRTQRTGARTATPGTAGNGTSLYLVCCQHSEKQTRRSSSRMSTSTLNQ